MANGNTAAADAPTVPIGNNTQSKPQVPSSSSTKTHQSIAEKFSAQHHIIWGVAQILFGGLIGFFWLWAHAVEIQTTEYLIDGFKGSVNLAPGLQIFLQIRQFGDGSLSGQQLFAYTTAWLTQVVLIAFSLNIKLHVGGRAYAWFWKWGSIAIIVVGSLGDLAYGGVFSAWWQPWFFAGLLLFVSIFIGIAAIKLIMDGFKSLFNIKVA